MRQRREGTPPSTGIRFIRSPRIHNYTANREYVFCYNQRFNSSMSLLGTLHVVEEPATRTRIHVRASERASTSTLGQIYFRLPGLIKDTKKGNAYQSVPPQLIENKYVCWFVRSFVRDFFFHLFPIRLCVYVRAWRRTARTQHRRHLFFGASF